MMMKLWLLAACLLVAAKGSAEADPILHDIYDAPRMSLEESDFPPQWPLADKNSLVAGFQPSDITDVEVAAPKGIGNKVALRGFLIIAGSGIAAMSNHRDGSNAIAVDFRHAGYVNKSNILNECSDRTFKCIVQIRGTLEASANGSDEIVLVAE